MSSDSSATVVKSDNEKIFNISTKKMILADFDEKISESRSLPSTPPRFKFLWVGTSHRQFTGYSRVSYAIMTQLAKTIGKIEGVEIHHYAFQGAKGLSDTFRPYPKDCSPHVWEVNEQEDPGKFAFGIEHFAKYVEKL